MSYNTFRTTSREIMKTSQNNGLSKSQNPKEKLINIQKREKLKGLLVTKFMKKYGIKNPEKLLQDEISRFLEGEKLTDSDLKRLDEKLRNMIIDTKNHEALKKNLTETAEYNTCGAEANEIVLPEVNSHKFETMSVRSKHSKMSGASNLSKFNEKNAKSQNCENVDDFDTLSMYSSKPLNRLDFSKEGDEWNAICLYNQKMFEEEKRLNKLKDMEIKRRTKDDLDNQIRQKLRNLNEEQLKNQEYDQITLKHTEYLNELEYKKQLEKQQKILREKDNRDKQLKDEKTRKKMEVYKEKKADKELGNCSLILVNYLLKEIEKEKKMMADKKQDEREQLHKTLKDNELNKVKQLECLRKEKEDDVRAAEELTKVLDKQEQERVEYFKRIERNGNNFMSKMVGTVLKDMENKNKEEEERMKTYLQEKELR